MNEAMEGIDECLSVEKSNVYQALFIIFESLEIYLSLVDVEVV